MTDQYHVYAHFTKTQPSELFYTRISECLSIPPRAKAAGRYLDRVKIKWSYFKRGNDGSR